MHNYSTSWSVLKEFHRLPQSLADPCLLVLFHYRKGWNQPKYPSIDEKIWKCDAHTQWNSIQLKRKIKIKLFSGKCMVPVNLLITIIQVQKENTLSFLSSVNCSSYFSNMHMIVIGWVPGTSEWSRRGTEITFCRNSSYNWVLINGIFILFKAWKVINIYGK